MKRLLQTLLLLVLPSCGMADDKVQHVEAEGAAKIIAEGKAMIIDVRTSDEFVEGHIEGARNIDILSDDFEAQLAKLDKTKPTLVHCQAGGRSTRALPIFQKLGFTNLIHLDGGFGGWQAAGKPVHK